MKVYMAFKNNLSEPFWIPKELVDVIVTNNLSMIFFLSHEFTVHDFIALVTHETVEGFNDCFEIETLLDRFDPALALWTTIVVVCTFEYKAEALWNKADVPSLAPTQEVECDLTKAVILAHVVHGVSPAVKSS